MSRVATYEGGACQVRSAWKKRPALCVFDSNDLCLIEFLQRRARENLRSRPTGEVLPVLDEDDPIRMAESMVRVVRRKNHPEPGVRQRADLPHDFALVAE